MTKKTITSFMFLAAVLFAAACGPSAPPGEQRGISEGMRFSITADSLPPRAGDMVSWRIRVRDAKTGQPIVGGQGQIWGRNKDMHPTYNGFEEAKELGVYIGKLVHVNAGPWQMSVRFRRDSLSPFGQINWLQEVMAARPLGGG